MAGSDVSRASLEALSARLDEVEGYLHIDERRAEVARLEQQSAQPDFWSDADAASGAAEAKAAANTGDESNIILWFIIIVASLILMVAANCRRKLNR